VKLLIIEGKHEEIGMMVVPSLYDEEFATGQANIDFVSSIIVEELNIPDFFYPKFQPYVLYTA